MQIVPSCRVHAVKLGQDPRLVSRAVVGHDTPEREELLACQAVCCRRS
jgi:hypothetical protein